MCTRDRIRLEAMEWRIARGERVISAGRKINGNSGNLTGPRASDIVVVRGGAAW